MTALAFRTCYEFHLELVMDVGEFALMVHLPFKTGARSILDLGASFFKIFRFIKL